jgi:hypothetical protein
MQKNRRWILIAAPGPFFVVISAPILHFFLRVRGLARPRQRYAENTRESTLLTEADDIIVAARSCSLANTRLGTSCGSVRRRTVPSLGHPKLSAPIDFPDPIPRSAGLGFSCDRAWVIRKGRAADRFKILCCLGYEFGCHALTSSH